MILIEDFPHRYEVGIDPGWSEDDNSLRTFTSYSGLHMHTGEFRNIRFYPEHDVAWTARFETGQREGFTDALLTTPDVDSACIVSCGAGYWFNVAEKHVTYLRYLPITGVLTSKEHRLIVIATWRDIFVHRASGVPEWELRGLFQDRLQLIAIQGDTLTVHGFDGEDVSLQIDVVRGVILHSIRLTADSSTSRD